MILKKWWFILRYFLFWMVIFTIYRIIFIVIYYEKFQNDSFYDILKNFYQALYLDASAASYISVLPVIFLGLGYLFQNEKYLRAINIYSIIMIFCYGFIAIGEDGIYGEWGTKLNYQALSHFMHFSEVLKTISTSLMISFFAATFILGGIFTWVYWRYIRLIEMYTEINQPAFRVILGIIVLGVNALLVFTGVRGGWYPIPISQSVCYYSSNPVLNDAAINPAWNLVSNISENIHNLERNPYLIMKDEDAQKIVKDLYRVPYDSTIEILSNTRPNICFIILESWSANMVKSCGGLDGITPVFDSLSKEGVLFDNMISSSIASDQGMAAILSGYPHTYRMFFTHQASKAKQIGCINKPFQDKGYHSGFYFGGQLSYGNIKSYLYSQNFDIVKEEKDFDNSLPRARLGIHDGIMMQQYAQGMNIAVSPFIYCLFTLSSHMPYDIPVAHEFDQLKEEGEYASSVHYSDASLREFFKTARTMPWYKNTLFVLVADHSHTSPIFQMMQSSEFHHIPCLFFGEVIKKKYHGIQIHRTVMQSDIAATLLRQCDMTTTAFPWSRNMLNSATPEWAFYPVQLGGGFTNGKNWVSFDTDKNRFFLSNASDSVEIKKLRKKGEALQQVLFSEFLRF